MARVTGKRAPSRSRTDGTTALILPVRRLASEAQRLRFGPPVSHVYNPLIYARRPLEAYLSRAQPGCRALFVGMNPGPWGMAQTGVPFGVVDAVRDWLGIDEPVDQPPRLHPRRPVQGFDCTRMEVSGSRVWGWARRRYRTPRRFFRQHFIWNYCPLVFFDEAGRNLTPDRLSVADRARLFRVCDRALRQLVQRLEPRFAIGIGKFAEGRLRQVLDAEAPRLGGVLHPSPASPAANRGWVEQAERQLVDLGVLRAPTPGRRTSAHPEPVE